jgi:hypothetical protein
MLLHGQAVVICGRLAGAGEALLSIAGVLRVIWWMHPRAKNERKILGAQVANCELSSPIIEAPPIATTRSSTLTRIVPVPKVPVRVPSSKKFDCIFGGSKCRLPTAERTTQLGAASASELLSCWSAGQWPGRGIMRNAGPGPGRTTCFGL